MSPEVTLVTLVTDDPPTPPEVEVEPPLPPPPPAVEEAASLSLGAAISASFAASQELFTASCSC